MKFSRKLCQRSQNSYATTAPREILAIKGFHVDEGVKRVLLLCKGYSPTNWWQTAAKDSTLITAVDHRLQFQGTDYAAPFPVHVMIFGDVPPALVDALDNHGLLAENSRTATPSQRDRS